MEKYVLDYLAPYVRNPFAEENALREQTATPVLLPRFDSAQPLLPQPLWENHDSVIACYWRAWELAFRHLHLPRAENGFVAPFIDTVFEDQYASRSLYMWDTAFISLFARYGMGVFAFHHMLNNFYAKQHPDGFICRQLRLVDGSDAWHRFDPNGTGPNIFAWVEWQHYQHTGDRDRLAQVFPALVAYHQWLRANRTWRDGSYWSTGLSCGMDNLPRFSTAYYYGWQHDHLVWVDACLQQILSARCLLKIASVLGRERHIKDMEHEAEHLTTFVNAHLWDEEDGFYYDLQQDGRFVRAKTVAAYWALLASTAPPERRTRLVDHLRNPILFNRPHRVPALSADQPEYNSDGDYWRGGVWSPTNAMILAGLREQGCYALAHEIARNHVENVSAVFQNTGTLWENYAPENPTPGKTALPDLVGWTGLSAISILLEDVFGLSYEHHQQRLMWRIHLLDAHGVIRYPLGRDHWITVRAERRETSDARPTVRVESTQSLTLMGRWGDDGQHQFVLNVPASQTISSF